MEFPFVAKIITALVLGAAVGFERESHEHFTNKTSYSGRGSHGVRSYMLISLLGVLSGLLYTTHIFVFGLITAAFLMLLLGYFLLGSWINKDVGMTTELAMLLNFLFAVVLGLGNIPTQIIIALTIVLILVMSLKSEIKDFVATVRENELNAFISFALIALVIFPFLPNTSLTLSHIPGLTSLLQSLDLHFGKIIDIELLNPFNLWKVVVIITGIEIVGYLLEKTLGQKNSWLLTSLAGGFISSTSTTQSLAIKSKTSSNVNGLVAAAIFANFSSFIQHFLLIASINAVLLVAGIPYLLSILGSALAIGIFMYVKSKKGRTDDLKDTRKELGEIKIFSLKPALQFALLFTGVKLLSKIFLEYFGQEGFLFATGIASLTGIDAVTFSVGEIAGNSITYQTAIFALVFANAINLLAKTFYSYMQGSKAFAVRFGIAALVIITSSLFVVML